MRFFDAHNHLQDERFGGLQHALLEDCRAAGVVRMVVNGSCEEDWPAVAELARRFPDVVVPSFGLHPWFVRSRSANWFDALRRWLDSVPGAVVGEIGLDRWILECPPAAKAVVSPDAVALEAASLAEQEAVFVPQWREAAERNVAASVHCLQAWGRLHDLLRAGPSVRRGFLLHSYGGSADLVRPLAALGARFGFPGYFLHARKARQRTVFGGIPADRLLVETDAPDQRLPATPEWQAAGDGTAAGEWHPREWPAGEPTRPPLNLPENLALVYRGLAQVRGEAVETLATRVEGVFRELFGPHERSQAG